MKKAVLILIVVFSLLAIDLPVMLAYQSTITAIPVSGEEQIKTLDYVFGKGDLDVDYTAEEASHLEDVRQVIKWMNYYFVFLLLAEILILVVIFNLDRKELWKAFFYGGIVSTSVLGVTLLWAFFDFSSLFTFFHQIFFPMGNWQFPVGSKLVTLFDYYFFFSLAREIFVKALVFSLLMFLAGLWLRRKSF